MPPPCLSRPDLHTHSTSSDGIFSPLQLVERAAQEGITLLSVTDHDSLGAYDTLCSRSLPLPVLPGLELSLRDMHGLHLLGYGTAPAPELHAVTAQLADLRRSRAKRFTIRLTELGMPLDYDELAAHCAGSIGRPHIARAMLAAGYVSSFEEAFSRWLGKGRPAYISGDKLSMDEALPLLVRNGFIPVLAHPAELEKDDPTLLQLLKAWQSKGLRGVEVYHPSQLRRGFAPMDAMARRMGLLVTGGSDFHCEGDRHGTLGCTSDAWQRRDEDIQLLLEAVDDAHRRTGGDIPPASPSTSGE